MMTEDSTPLGAVAYPLEAASGPSRGVARWLAPGLVALLTVAAFLPTLGNGFVNWDDDVVLVTNPRYRGLGWSHLKWMFTTFHMGHYQPLTWVTYGLDYLLWGMNPAGYHLTSLLLHAATAVSAYSLTRRLLQLAVPDPLETSAASCVLGAAFAALLFALHPLRVESVAWATERRDVLSGLFYLLTLLAYLRAVAASQASRPHRRWLTAAVGLYALALLSKVMAVSLPVILVVLDVYPLRRLGGGRGRWMGPAARAVWWEKVPFLLIAGVAALIAPFATAHAGPFASLEKHGVAARVAVVLYGLAFYLWKTVVPLGLSPLYELAWPLNPLAWPFVLSGIVVLVISGALVVARRRWPAGLAIWVSFIAILLPVQGIVQTGNQIAADRYTYLACLGLAVLAGAGLHFAWRRSSREGLGEPAIALISGVAVVIVGVLGGLTWRQVKVWHDSPGLWQHALTVDPNSAIAHNNLGASLADQGRYDQAIPYYQQSLRLRPTYAKAHNNLGVALAKQGQLEAAEQEVTFAARLAPSNVAVQLNLANIYGRLGKAEEAEATYRRLLHQNPFPIKAYLDLGALYLGLGRLEEGIALFHQALVIEPDNAEAWNGLGVAHLQQGKIGEAVTEFRRGLRRSPEDIRTRSNLATAYLLQGKFEDGIAELKRAVALDPGNASLLYNLGLAYQRAGRPDLAAEAFRRSGTGKSPGREGP